MSIESRSRQYGVVFDHWQIKEFLGSGSGGKSAVFRLSRIDSTWGRSALKVINLIEEKGNIDSISAYRRNEYEQAKYECKKSAEQEVRFMDEMHGNTHIVDYLDHKFVDWSDETGFGCDMLIRMELLEDLRGKLRDGYQYSEKEVLKIGRDICTALVLCHRKDILHRDIKPENIFINSDGYFKLGDFGVSRILSAAPTAVASTGIGTPEYAAPEQFSGGHDKRVDIYSLGLVLYELSNGNKLPFASTSYARPMDVERRQMGEPLPAPCNASSALSSIILKACAYKKEDRYQTAEEFLIALRSVSGSSTSAPVKNVMKGSASQKAVSSHSGNVTQKASADVIRRSDHNTTQRASADDVRRVNHNTSIYAENVVDYRSRRQLPQKRKKTRSYLGLGIGLLLIITAMICVFTFGKPKDSSEGKVVPGDYSSEEFMEEPANQETGDINHEGLAETLFGNSENASPEKDYVELTSLKVIDSSYYYSLYDGMILDTYGNAYTGVGTFRECGTHYAIYYTEGKYDTLYGTIAAPDSIGSGGVSITVNVYADDQLIHTIPSITRKTKPVNLELDITGADTVKIEAITTNVYPTGVLFKLGVSKGKAPSQPSYISSLNYGNTENVVNLKAIDSSYYYSVENGAITDTYGNTYTKVGRFRECGTHHVLYYTAQKYSTLKGVIAAPDSIGGEGVAITVNIYADDVLIHTIPTITRLTKPIEIELDIAGADNIKIEAITTNYYPTGVLFQLEVS